MTEYEVLKYSVYNALGVGAKNAQTRKELCHSVGCSDRMLRKAIEDLRRNRAIITNDDGTGYYIPATTDEGRKETWYWLCRQKKRMKSIKRALRGAERFVNTRTETGVPGQLSLFD